MNTILNHNFRCECCGTTEPLFDEEITVTLIGTNGVIEKKVCYECADKMKQNDPRYLGHMTTRFLDPAMQEITEQRFNAWKERQKKYSNDFTLIPKSWKCTKRFSETELTQDLLM